MLLFVYYGELVHDVILRARRNRRICEYKEAFK